MVGRAPAAAPAPSSGRRSGYVFIMLLFLLTVMAVGLMVAYPVWKTQIQREKEEELIFRGKQYVEAIRLYQLKNPGRFPKSFKELYEKRFLRRLFPDPMVRSGDWDIILQSGTAAPRPGSGRRGGGSPQEVIVAPAGAVASLNNPLIIGVVSSSTEESIKIYNDQTTYDKWLFYIGQDPKKNPTIIYLGRKSSEIP
jgi:type II secretory pathway pseudopilin PulG